MEFSHTFGDENENNYTGKIKQNQIKLDTFQRTQT